MTWEYKILLAILVMTFASVVHLIWRSGRHVRDVDINLDDVGKEVRRKLRESQKELDRELGDIEDGD